MEKSKIMSTFGERLKKARFDAKVVQWDLAKKAGITQATIAQYELGLILPRPDKIRALANALGVDVDWLASDEVVVPKTINTKAANNGDSEMMGKTIGKRLEEALKNADFDVKKLSALTSIPEKTLNEYLKDQAPILVIHVELIASVLGASKSWLAFGKN